MLQTLTDVLTLEGFAWKPSSLECMTTGDQLKLSGGFDLAVQGEPLHVPQKQKFNCLGTRIRHDGDIVAST